jgi:hypothetical protein
MLLTDEMSSPTAKLLTLCGQSYNHPFLRALGGCGHVGGAAPRRLQPIGQPHNRSASDEPQRAGGHLFLR